MVYSVVGMGSMSTVSTPMPSSACTVRHADANCASTYMPTANSATTIALSSSQNAPAATAAITTCFCAKRV